VVISATEGMRDIVRDAFFAVIKGEEVRTEKCGFNLRSASAISTLRCARCATDRGAIIGARAGGRRHHPSAAGPRKCCGSSQKMESGRPVDRRRGPRFHNLLTIISAPATDFPAPPRTAGGAPPPLRRRDFRDRGTGLQADRAVAGIRPPPAAEAAGLQCRQPGRRRGAAHSSPGRRPDYQERGRTIRHRLLCDLPTIAQFEDRR